MQRVGLDRTVKNKWLWRGMQRIGIELFNVAGNDVEELRTLGVELKKNGRFVSANLLSSQSGEPLLDPYVIKTISAVKTNRMIRLGFIGLSAQVKKYSQKNNGVDYHWSNPLTTVKRWLPELREQCDFVIALACMPTKDAIQLAIDNSGIDLIINGFEHQHQHDMSPIQISRSTIVYAEDEAKSLGELRFSLKLQGKPDVQSLNYRLTREVKDDPEMASFMVKAKAQIAARQAELARRVTATDKLPQGGGLSSFVTSETCRSCHLDAFKVWENSAHAHAIDILKKEKKEFDTQCVVCHVTGSGQPGGFTDLYRTSQLANVQCEACHGQGRAHSQQPTGIKMDSLGPISCLGCHNRSNSPEFEFVSYWEAIKH